MFCAVLLLVLPLAAADIAPWPTETWATSTPEQQGLDSALLQAGSDYIQTQCPNRYSFLVVRNGYLVWERYFSDMSRDRYAHVMSVSKSVLSLMIGQAIAAGKIESLDTRLVDYFPEYFTSSTDPRKRQITLRNMIMMEAGFQWDEVRTAPQWVASKDWYKFIVDLPMAANPGEVFNYNTGLSHLLAGVLSRASGQSALSFGIENLFSPLGIWNFYWETDPRGNYIGGFRMHFTSRDLAKFGYLALRKGYWENRQVVPRQWIEDSTTAYIAYATPTTIGDYAYHWWVRSEWGYPAFMAAGFGGQYIFVVPGLDLVMVSTARDDADTLDRQMQAFNLLNNYVIPAVKSYTDPKVIGRARIAAIVNGETFDPRITPGSWATIFGSNLSTATRCWNAADFIGGNAPSQLDGVTVSIGGRLADVAYISPIQLNVRVPEKVVPGDVDVIVTPAAGYSTTVKMKVDPRP